MPLMTRVSPLRPSQNEYVLQELTAVPHSHFGRVDDPELDFIRGIGTSAIDTYTSGSVIYHVINLALCGQFALANCALQQRGSSTSPVDSERRRCAYRRRTRLQTRP